MGKGGAKKGTSIAQRLEELEARVESLDNAVREVHPNYSGPIVRRVEELEQLCRSHANRVFEILVNNKAGVEAAASSAIAKADEACARLDQAAARHQSEGASLRQEWGLIKENIDFTSAQVEQDLANMSCVLQKAVEHQDKQETLNRAADLQLARLARFESFGTEVQAGLRQIRAEGRDFRTDQRHIVSRAHCRSASLPAVIREAQRCAESRSPSSRIQVAVSRYTPSHPGWLWVSSYNYNRPYHNYNRVRTNRGLR